MESLSTPCVFCGVDRPLASDVCPTCGRGWIDARVSDLADTPPPPPTPDDSSAEEAAEHAESVSNPGHHDDPDPDEDDELIAIVPATFSDASNTGFDSLEPDEPAQTPQHAEPDETPGGDPDLTSEIAAASGASREPADAAAMPPETDESRETEGAPAIPSDGPGEERAAAEAEELIAQPAEATSMFAAAPPATPDEPVAEDVTDAGLEPTPADSTTPETAAPDHERTTGEDLDTGFPAQAPDELGILPAVTAAGPPQYLPDPAEAAAAPPAASDDTAPPPAEPPTETPPPAPPAASDDTAPPPAEPPTETAPAARGVADDVAALDEHPPDELGVIPVIESPPPAPSPAAEPEPPAAAPPSPPPLPSIDPDGLIDEVFADDLVDGRPPAASDAMLDDPGAWSQFAASEAASPAAPPPAAAPPPSETPSTAGTFPGEDPATSPFFAGDSLPSDAPAPPSGDRRASSGRSRWSQTAIVAVIVLGIIGAWFVVLAWITNDGEDEPTAAGGDDAPSSTVATTDAPDTTAATTSSTSSTTTTSTTTTIPTIEPAGDPIPLEDLGLGAFALGPIDFDATDALPRLVASLEQPDAIADSSGANGLCPDDTGFTAQWGPFSAIFIGALETNVFVGYRLEADGDDPTASLATLSGLQVGDTVETLESTYEGFELVYEEIDGQLNFILVRTSDDATLLWGPVSSSEADGVVEGIYSPRSCDDGPAPSS